MKRLLLIAVALLVPALGHAQGLNLSTTLGWHDLTNLKMSATGCPSPSPGGSGNCEQIERAWGGGLYDTSRNRLVMFGGGHSDYFGNEMFALDLAHLTFPMLTTPTVAANLNLCQNATVDSPTRAAARHTYGGLQYWAPTDKYYIFGGAQACGSGVGTNGSWKFDPTAANLTVNGWTVLSTPFNGGQGVTQTAVDSANGLIWLDDGQALWRFNPSTDTLSSQLTCNGCSNFDIYSTMVVDPDNHLLWQIGTNGTPRITRTDISSPLTVGNAQQTNPTLDATCSALVTQAPGLDWDPVMHVIVGWPNFGNSVVLFNDGPTNSVTTPYGTIAAGKCVTITYAGGPPDSAHDSNTASTTHGTFGRFRYVPAANVYVLTNDWNIDSFYLRLTNVASTIQSFQLTTPNSGTFPFTVGLGFKKGDIPSGSTPSLVNSNTSQAVIKSTWNDGSVKTAIVSGRAALTANVAKAINVVIGTNTGTAMTCSNIQTAAPSASVQVGAIGTVSLSSLLASPFRTWVSGPEMVECHYRAQVGSDPSLVVWYHVRLYADNRVWVRANVENGYVDVATANKSYIPTVTIGGTVVYNNSGASLTHYANTRWTAEGWIGGNPQITPQHDARYLEATKLVPNYLNLTPSAAGLNGLAQTYTPMNGAGWTPDMGSTGFQNQIGILPLWDAMYVTSNADSRAYNAVLTGAKALNSYPIVWNDSVTKLPTDPVSRPTYTFAGPNGGGATSINAGSNNFDIAHHGSAGYLAYILTGDYFYLETLEDLASMCFLLNNSAHGSGVNRTFESVVQDRGVAWCNRTLSQLAAVAPSTDTVAADYRTLLANTATTLNNRVQAVGVTPIGYFLTYDITTGSYLPFNGNANVSVNAVWQQHFMIQSLGFGSDIEPLATMTNYTALRDWAYKGVVGILGPNGSGNYCFTDASEYNLQVADTQTGNLTLWYPDWGTVWSKNHSGVPNTSCANTLQGSSGSDPLNASTGYWGNLIPAAAYATDHNAAGASASWTRLTSATNWTSVLNSGFNDIPMWGVTTRASITPAPAVSLNPVSLTFANQVISTTSASQSVTLTNNGNASLNVTSISLTGTNPADFTISSNTCGTTLAQGNACVVQVAFKPTALASRSANLTFTTNASTSPDNVTLSGTGISSGSPAATFTPTSVAFGSVKVSQSSGPTPITLKNSGNATMSITAIAITGANSAEFSQTNTCGATLAANGTCAINVSFTPASIGGKSASVSVSSNTSTSPDAAPLTGTGIAPAVALSSNVANFFNQMVGTTTSIPKLVVLTNTGTAALTVGSVTIAGINAADFAQSNDCGTSVLAGAFCTITITFSPSVLAGRSASISIADDASGSPHVIALSGNGMKTISGTGTITGTGVVKVQ